MIYRRRRKITKGILDRIKAIIKSIREPWF